MPEAGMTGRHKLLLDVSEVAETLGCGRTFVYGLISSGQLVPVKLGKLTRVPAATVEAFVARKSLEATPTPRHRLSVGNGVGRRG
jgi:excisionase family DNA binding protein